MDNALLEMLAQETLGFTHLWLYGGDRTEYRGKEFVLANMRTEETLHSEPSVCCHFISRSSTMRCLDENVIVTRKEMHHWHRTSRPLSKDCRCSPCTVSRPMDARPPPPQRGSLLAANVSQVLPVGCYGFEIRSFENCSNDAVHGQVAPRIVKAVRSGVSASNRRWPVCKAHGGELEASCVLEFSGAVGPAVYGVLACPAAEVPAGQQRRPELHMWWSGEPAIWHGEQVVWLNYRCVAGKWDPTVSDIRRVVRPWQGHELAVHTCELSPLLGVAENVNRGGEGATFRGAAFKTQRAG